MLSARHLGTVSVTPESNVNLFWGLILITWLAIEANAIKGKLGPITTIKGVITGGFVLTAWIYAVMSFTL
jgi:hypothetical protein